MPTSSLDVEVGATGIRRHPMVRPSCASIKDADESQIPVFMETGMRRWIGLVIWACTGTSAGRADDWPQWFGPQRDGVWRESGLIEKFPAGGPKVLWRTPIGGGYAGPAVAAGKVYVTDRVLPAGASNPESGFKVVRTKGRERILCLDEKTGQLVWKHEYDCPYQVQYPAGPRTTPVVHGDRVWTLGAMGDLICLDTAGKLIWSKNLAKEYDVDPPRWGFSAHPLLDG